MKYRFIDIINPYRWYLALRRKEEERTNVTEVPTDEIGLRSELYVYRSTLCPKCYEDGVAECCGCPWEAKATVPGESCKKGNWNKATKKSWFNTKEALNLEFKIVKKDDKI